MEMLLGLTATGCRENWSGEKCRRGSKYLASQVLITGHQACKVRRAINPSPVPQPLQQSIVLKTFTQHVNPYPNQNQKPNLNMNLISWAAAGFMAHLSQLLVLGTAAVIINNKC